MIPASAATDAVSIHYPPELPVSQRRDDLMAAIRDNQVVIVAGETGSGKSTQLPKLCLELGRGVRGLIGHTQPRRIAARSVAERVAEELSVRTRDRGGAEAKLAFVNRHCGHLLRTESAEHVVATGRVHATERFFSAGPEGERNYRFRARKRTVRLAAALPREDVRAQRHRHQVAGVAVRRLRAEQRRAVRVVTTENVRGEHGDERRHDGKACTARASAPRGRARRSARLHVPRPRWNRSAPGASAC